MSEIKKNSFHGVIIKVQNLDVCRSFYRDMLGLGAPVLDSNFWVEFKLQDGVSLILEQILEGENIPSGQGRVSWLYRPAELDALKTRMKAHGHEPVKLEYERLGNRVIVYKDPEGNFIYLFLQPDGK